jgi:FAD:protein FMN transferase
MPGLMRSGKSRAQTSKALRRVEDYHVGSFDAMGGPCEVLLDTEQAGPAGRLLEIARTEALRVESKFSRYRPDNIVAAINRSGGRPIPVDEETALLIEYAVACYEMSDGMFDITSGVLRRVWRFDGGDHVPTEGEVAEVLHHVGWHRVEWKDSILTMPEGMEIDLGGIGKEYAVDRASSRIAAETDLPFLVNFGGDIFARGPRRDGRPWVIGIDDPDRTGEALLYRVDLSDGGLATSGDARRYVMHRGRRLGHILNPRTGWPVENAPRAVTVLATTCIEAGSLSTLAFLQGPGAQAFLEEQGVQFRLM